MRRTNCTHNHSMMVLQNLVLLSLFLEACSHTVILGSEPTGAQVTLVDAQGKKGQNLGATPLRFDLTAANLQTLVISKEGYEPLTLVLPSLLHAESRVDVTLLPRDKESFARELRTQRADVLGSALTQLLRLQSAILSKRDSEVNELALAMKVDFERIAAFHAMMGGYFYLKGEAEEAKIRYKRALELDPTFEEARKMLALLDNGGR